LRARAREQLPLCLLAPGREVSEFRLVAVEAEVDRDLRIQLRHFGDEPLSQGINRGGRAVSHGSTSNSWAESGGPRKCYPVSTGPGGIRSEERRGGRAGRGKVGREGW